MFLPTFPPAATTSSLLYDLMVEITGRFLAAKGTFAENMSDTDTQGDFWDAGQLGCGELVIELRQRMRRLPPKQLFHLIAHDGGAVEDIPAWCRLTGHKLLRVEHPNYFIERKDES